MQSAAVDVDGDALPAVNHAGDAAFEYYIAEIIVAGFGLRAIAQITPQEA